MSGEHRGRGRHTDGEYDPRSGEYRTVGGSHASGGYPTGEYPSGEYPRGEYPSGEYPSPPSRPGGYGSGSGEYGSGGYAARSGSGQYGTRDYGSGEYGTRESGPYRTGGPPSSSGGYPSSSGGYSESTYTSGTYTSGGSAGGGYGTSSRTSGSYGTTVSGPYGATTRSSGPYGTRGSGDYGLRDREYGSTSGEYGTGTGEYRRPGSSRTSPGSGGYRATTGSHRVVRDRRTGRKNLGLLLTGVVSAVVACVLAAFVFLGDTGQGEDEGGGQVGAATAGGSPSAGGERSGVPDACELVPQELADRLAPNADRTQANNYQASDRQNQCIWGAYTGSDKRQLTVELRALAGGQGKTATDVAGDTFDGERQADEGGKSLLAGQELAQKSQLDGVGDEGYVIYLVDDGQGSGEAVANVRTGNVLITIHYSGGNDGDPLGGGDAINGATEVAKTVVQALSRAS